MTNLTSNILEPPTLKKTLSNEILLMENSDTELTICIKMMLVIVFLDILSIFFT